MILLYGSGRFGNQIFEYVYTESLRKKNEKVYCYGMKSLLDAIGGNQFYRNTDDQKKIRFYNRVLRRILKILVKLHIISMINDDGDGNITKSKGILPFLYINGYYQSDKYYSKEFLSSLKNGEIVAWKEEDIQAAKSFITKNTPEGKNPCFIHVRHGDYPEDWKLNESYYSSALKAQTIENPHYFIFGDDPEWCEKFFKNLPSKTISRNSFMVDFLSLTQCKGGIISNSSFAWWGAYLCKDALEIIAPNYWLGHQKKQWIPKDIKTECFKWIDC